MEYSEEVRRIFKGAATSDPVVMRVLVEEAIYGSGNPTIISAWEEAGMATGRFGYPPGQLPSMYEDTDTAALKAEREMFAEIAESRTPQEYIEILRRYNRLSDLAENPVTRQMRREKAELAEEDYRQYQAALEASRKEVERQQARKHRPTPPPTFDPIDYFPQHQRALQRRREEEALKEGYRREVQASKPVPVGQGTNVSMGGKDDELPGEWWPYDPAKPIGDGDRSYQQRFQQDAEQDDGEGISGLRHLGAEKGE